MRKVKEINPTIKERIILEAKYIVDNKATIVQTAKNFHVSTTTVFMDMNKLKKFNEELAKEVQEVFKLNKSQRHIRGGMATKEKWLKVK